MIDANLSGAARTLMFTLRARADEHTRPDRLFDDQWSAEWNIHAPEYDDFDEWYNPVFQLASAIRTRIIDDAVNNFIDSHDNPLIVELGSGLSTRYYRCGHGKDVRWVEMDLPEAIAVRRKIDVETQNHWFLSGSLDDDAWLTELPDVKAKDTLFIAEGVAMFLEPDTVDALFDALKNHAKGATVVFDVIHERTREQMNQAFNGLDAPMLWGVTPDDLKQYGLKVDSLRYILTEFSDRWAELDVNPESLTQERSGYIVTAQLK